MRRHKLPQSVRKFIRHEKARLRRFGLDLETQKKLIEELYLRYQT
ncbi:MAG: hypothetical protein V1892_00795 [bacterium]